MKRVRKSKKREIVKKIEIDSEKGEKKRQRERETQRKKREK